MFGAAPLLSGFRGFLSEFLLEFDDAGGGDFSRGEVGHDNPSLGPSAVPLDFCERGNLDDCSEEAVGCSWGAAVEESAR
jgi:hypothetical protein